MSVSLVSLTSLWQSAASKQQITTSQLYPLTCGSIRCVYIVIRQHSLTANTSSVIPYNQDSNHYNQFPVKITAGELENQTATIAFL